MARRLAGITGLVLVAGLLWPSFGAAEDFPLRAEYGPAGVDPIETGELAANLDRYTIVDARSPYEYETLHIEGAHSIPLASSEFSEKVSALAEETGKTLVFYCNGVTCAVSYKATLKAHSAGVEDALVYDAGIFSWAKANPDRSVLLGETLGDPAKLISSGQFQAHLLEEDPFFARIDRSENPIIVDIRNRDQRAGISLFQMRDRHVPLSTDNSELDELILLAKTEERPMFFVDATGKQVRWLQYYLENKQVPEYWFLKGGVSRIYENMGI
ncbi:MAG: rhodanese-like domain-containing protein [Pseudomonadota bacterium]